MELRDLIVTPIITFLVYAAAYLVRPYVTNDVNRRYFFPALTVKILGAIGVGIIYQFYYRGGDTFMYHTYGSRVIWNAFMDSPEVGFKLLFSDLTNQAGVYKYSSQIYFLRDSQSFAVIRLAALFDLITFSTYSATAILFAVCSFAGLWLFFLTFFEQYPKLHRGFAIALFFIPSVFFWGSGLLKDTITIGCLGAAVFFTYRIFIRNQFNFLYAFFLFLALYGLYVIKIYILLTFLPSTILWIFLSHFNQIHSLFLKIILFPAVISSSVLLGFFALQKAGEENPKYSLSMISKTAQVTAYDIRFWSGREAGSGYTLGELDGSWQSLLELAPSAINVSLFRPFFWEVNNPLMLLSAIESFILTVFTVVVITRLGNKLLKVIFNPAIFYCLVFSITFAFAVGVSTFNFGTLSRYKIPMVPFYSIGLVLMLSYVNRDRNTGEFETTE